MRMLSRLRTVAARPRAAALLSSDQLAEAAGITRRQVQYIAGYKILRPFEGGRGGKRRRWSQDQRLEAAIAGELIGRRFSSVWMRRRIINLAKYAASPAGRDAYLMILLGRSGEKKAYWAETRAAALHWCSAHPGGFHLISIGALRDRIGN